MAPKLSMRWVHAFDPLGGEFKERASMPVPVDDAIAVVYQDRYIYLISGWHDFGNVNLVQQYDVIADSWSQATPTLRAGSVRPCGRHYRRHDCVLRWRGNRAT